MYLFSGLPTAAGAAPANRSAIFRRPIPGRPAERDDSASDPLTAALVDAPVAERGWRAPGASALTHRQHDGVLALRTRRGCLVVTGDALGADPAGRRALVAEARSLARDAGRQLVATGLGAEAADAWSRLGFRLVRRGASIRMDFRRPGGAPRNGSAVPMGGGTVSERTRPDGKSPPIRNARSTRDVRSTGSARSTPNPLALEVLPLSWEEPLRRRLGGTVPRRALEALVESAAHSGDVQGAGPVVLIRRDHRLVAAGRIWRECVLSGVTLPHGAVNGGGDGEAAVHIFWCSRRPGTAAAVAGVLAERATDEGVATLSIHLHTRRLGPLEARSVRALGGVIESRFTARRAGLAGMLAARLV